MLRTVVVLSANDRGTLLPTSKKRSRTSSFLSFFLSFPLVLDPEMMAPSGLPLLPLSPFLYRGRCDRRRGWIGNRRHFRGKHHLYTSIMLVYGESGMGSLISTPPPPKPNREPEKSARGHKPKMRKCFFGRFSPFCARRRRRTVGRWVFGSRTTMIHHRQTSQERGGGKECH